MLVVFDAIFGVNLSLFLPGPLGQCLKVNTLFHIWGLPIETGMTRKCMYVEGTLNCPRTSKPRAKSALRNNTQT
jgi:hypothetical protein